MQEIINKSIPHIIAIGIFLFVSFLYMSPVFQGKAIEQIDVTKAKGMQKEIADYNNETGDYTLWTNSMFGGMPSYQILNLGVPKTNIYEYLGSFIRLGLPRHSVEILFIYMLGFYIMLLAFGIKPFLSIPGALAFGFGTLNLLLIEAGHVNKSFAIGLMPMVIAGIILTFRKMLLLIVVLNPVSTLHPGALTPNP